MVCVLEDKMQDDRNENQHSVTVINDVLHSIDRIHLKKKEFPIIYISICPK